MTLEDFELQDEGATEPHAAGKQAVLEIRSRELDLAAAEPDLDVVVRIPEARVPDLAHYNRYLPAESSLRLVGGSGTVASELRAGNQPPRLNGWARLEGYEVAALLDDLRIDGALVVSARLPKGDPTLRRFDLDGTRIEVHDASFGFDGAADRSEGWWGEVDIERGWASLGSPIELEGDLRTRLRDTGPFVGFFQRDGGGPKWLQSALTVEDVEGRARVLYSSGATALRDLELSAGEHLRLSGEVLLSRATPRALLLLQFRQLTAALAVDGKQRNWDFVHSRRWFEERRRRWAGEPGDSPG
jgi:hypothetical protein